MFTSSLSYLRRPILKRGTTLAAAAAVALFGGPAFAQNASTPSTGNLPVRIALAPPKVDLGAGGPGDGAHIFVTDAIVSMLQGPSLEIVPLTARLDALIRAEAAQKQVDFVLFATVVRKPGKSGNFISRAVKAAGPAAALIPGGGAVAGQIKVAAASTAAELASTITSATQEKDEFTLEYRLTGPDTTSSRVAKPLKRKATHAGEDVLTPLMEEMGNAVLEAIAASR